MEEQQAHELYTRFQQVDRGAKQKQGLGFAGGGAGRGEYAGDDDDVIARNKRIRGALYGPSRDQDTGSDGYDSDSATAVVRRLKQLKREQGSAPGVAEAAQAAARRENSRAAGDGRGGTGGGRGDEREGGREKEHDRNRRQAAERSSTRGAEGSDRHRHRGEYDRAYRSREEDKGPRSSRREDDRDREHHRGRREDDGGHRGSSRRDAEREHRVSAGGISDRDWGRGRGGSDRHGSLGSSRAGDARLPPAQQRQREQRQQAGKPDFERLIPGFSSMTAAQKLKARTQFLLERSLRRDRRQAGRDPGEGSDGGQWTRFTFDQNAYLDEEGGRPADPTALGDEDDQGREAGLEGRAMVPRLNAVTFKESVAEAELHGRDASHEAAIFGRLPASLAGEAGAGVGAAPHGGGAAGASTAVRPRLGAPPGSAAAGNGRGGVGVRGAGPEGRRQGRDSGEPGSPGGGRVAGLGAEGGGSGWCEVPPEDEGVAAEGARAGGSGQLWEGEGTDEEAGGLGEGLLDRNAAARQAQLGWRERAALMQAGRGQKG